MAALLSAAGARGQDGGAAPPATERKVDAGKGPLSKEDAELVKDLALLERLELLRNLELFQEDGKPRQTKEERP